MAIIGSIEHDNYNDNVDCVAFVTCDYSADLTPFQTTKCWTGPNRKHLQTRNVAETIIFLLDKVENIVGKGENAGNHHFLPFPQCFQKASSSGLLKVQTVW